MLLGSSGFNCGGEVLRTSGCCAVAMLGEPEGGQEEEIGAGSGQCRWGLGHEDEAMSLWTSFSLSLEVWHTNGRWQRGLLQHGLKTRKVAQGKAFAQYAHKAPALQISFTMCRQHHKGTHDMLNVIFTHTKDSDIVRT